MSFSHACAQLCAQAYKRLTVCVTTYFYRPYVRLCNGRLYGLDYYVISSPSWCKASKTKERLTESSA